MRRGIVPHHLTEFLRKSFKNGVYADVLVPSGREGRRRTMLLEIRC